MSEPSGATSSPTPVMTEMLDSLAADYKAGRLPDDVKAQIDTLRDEFTERVRDRATDLVNDVTPDIDAFVTDLKAQIQAYKDDGGTLNSEVIDSRQIPIIVDVVDAAAVKLVDPVLDAVEDVVHDVFDLAHDLVQIRAEHDPEGIFASKLAAAQEELDRAGDTLDADMGKAHDEIEAFHEQMEQVRADAAEFHQHHAPVQVIMSTTVDPHLPAQMAEETGEGAT